MHLRKFNVYLERASTGTTITLEIKANSGTEARKKAKEELPQFEVVGATQVT